MFRGERKETKVPTSHAVILFKCVDLTVYDEGTHVINNVIIICEK